MDPTSFNSHAGIGAIAGAAALASATHSNSNSSSDGSADSVVQLPPIGAPLQPSAALLPSRSSDRVLHSFDISRDEIEILNQVGAGGFGVVYRARYRGVDAAVKMISAGASSNADLMKSFERELHVMSVIHNNRLVQVYGACRDPQQPFIVMEWMERGSLYDCLHSSNARLHPISMEQRLEMAIQILEGVTYMHSCRPPLLHTDIKSHNILVDRSWNVKIADFGFAQMVAHSNSSSLMSIRSNSSSKNGTLSCGGTLAYLPPEALSEDVIPPDTHLDMYATGVVLWELFSGQSPWNGLTFTQIMCQVGLYKKTLQMTPAIPMAIQTILKDLFAERKMRPSARQVLQALKDIQPGMMRELDSHSVAAGKSIESTYP